MMKRLLVLGAILAWSGSALAQQAQPDPQVAIYRQLLDEANNRFVQQTLRVQELQKEKDDLAAKAKGASAAPSPAPKQ